MKEKERLIIETAIKLFAMKGVNATSIQEIVTECGISKGAFYLYFKSKDTLVLATLEYYYDWMQNKLMNIENESLPPREKFEKQLHCQFYESQQKKEFIIMCMRENALPFNKEVETFMTRMKLESHVFYQKGLLSIYGEEIAPYLIDVIIMLEGISHGYWELIIFNRGNVDISYLVRFILKRMDDIVAGLQRSNDEPVIGEQELNYFLCDANVIKGHKEESFVNEIITLKRTLVDQLGNDELLVTLDVLESEMKTNHPRVPVIQGMLSNLKSYPELHDFRERLALYYKITN
ncbi:TetR/AcrR family transcriptional regulator [Bacillus sp. 3103sda1]|uniref:TetR/AcrR family transcriptional regulator n=1 Tax=Bacillus sp. 3103sda1 TaxID=2953808 RepID=UPI0020A11564|nr:TetR/AcrR family transcriptional regulator [Bacillus sp. 3103sda1]MCP1122842.1 TetR/AcrR family transcriptional regulator [Bacillus sp. 3103sda1]